MLDLAGFVASLYARGLKLVYIPTTTLAQADACIGGKTAVNLIGKNMIGTFYHPDAVLVDVDLLLKLPENIYLEGFSEVVKHGVIAGRSAIHNLTSLVDDVLARNVKVLEDVIRFSLQTKLSVIVKDYRERGLRTILNIGHTVGHALEASTNFQISHGMAVSAGIAMELLLASELLGFPQREKARVTELLKALKLPVRPPVPPSTIASYIKHDKKCKGTKIVVPLPERLGIIKLVSIKRGELESWLRSIRI